MTCHARFGASLFILIFVLSADVRADLYWDVNGTSTGASDDGNAVGTWGTDSFWNTDSNGDLAPGAWVADELAVFSAGSNATNAFDVTVSGTQSASGINFEDGFVTLVGGQIDLTGAATLNVPSLFGEATINSVIGGTAGLAATGTGVLRLGGANTYTGPTTIGTTTEGIVVRLLAADVIPDASVLTLVHGNVNTAFQLNGFDETVKSIASVIGVTGSPTIALGANTLTLEDDGEDQQYVGQLSSDPGGKVVKNGNGTLTLSGSLSTFTSGEFVLNDGTLALDNNNGLGTNTNDSKLTINSGTITNARTTSLNLSVKTVDIGGSFTFDNSPSFNSQFLGTGGNQIMNLLVDNPTITVNPGDPENPDSGGLLIFAGEIRDGGNGYDLTKAGLGTLTINNGNNQYGGDTTILEGYIRLVKGLGGQAVPFADGRLGDGTGTVHLSGGGLEYNGNLAGGATDRRLEVPNPINVTADSSIVYDQTTVTLTDNEIDFVFTSDNITGTGGTLTLRNDRSGTLPESILRPTFSGSGFDFGRPVVIDNGADPHRTVLESGNTTGNQTWSGVLSGTGSYRRNGSGGTSTLTGVNTYSGGTEVDAGSLIVSGASATLGTGDVTATGGELTISAGVANAIADTATVSLSGTGVMNLGTGIDELVSGLLLDGFAQPAGTYGSSSSSASFQFDTWFTGMGILTVAVATLDGDYNGDGTVDAADYVIWRKNPGANGGDPDGYNAWRANFGSSSGSGGGSLTSAVPEPTSLCLLLLAAGFGIGSRRSGRNRPR